MTLADRLRAGERLIGTVLAIGDPLLAELACTPFDFVWIDLEHSPLGVADVARLAVAARAARCAALVRVPLADRADLAAMLDAGVDGVVLPRVVGVPEVRSAAAALRYPPDGTRGFAHRRATGYGRRDEPGDRPVLAVQIESAGAVSTADEIARVPGVDMLVIGLADLALDLGVPPRLDEPAVRDALAAVRLAAQRAGGAWGVAAGGNPRALTTACAGATVLVYSADVRVYAEAMDRAAAELREVDG